MLYHPLFDLHPDFRGAPSYAISAPQDRVSLSAGRDVATFPTLEDSLLMRIQFATDSAREVFALAEFFRERGGSTMPFYMPSWRADIIIRGDAAAGTKLLPIDGTGYEAAHLDGTPEDWHGRQIWIWHPEEGLHADRVLRVVVDSGEWLDLDEPLPFDVSPECICGFCHLSRFGEDALSWRFVAERVAALDITFRATRAWSTVERTNSVTPITVEASLGFDSVTSFRTDSTPLEPVTARVAFADGPFAFHEPVDGYYVRRWAAYPGAGGIRLRKTDGEVWLPDDTGTLSELWDDDVSTDHITLAWDQTAFEVVAIQATPTTIELRHFYNGDVEAHTWEGTDPVAIWNYQLDATQDPADSDVVCYYLKPGDGRLFVRVQRELFEVEHVAAHLPFEALALRRGYLSDRRFYLEFLDSSFRIQRLRSAQYPALPPPPLEPEVYAHAGEELATASVEARLEYDASVIWTDGREFFEEHGPATAHRDAAFSGLEGPITYIPDVVHADGLGFYEVRDPYTEGAGTGIDAPMEFVRNTFPTRTGPDLAGTGITATLEHKFTVQTPGPSAEAVGSGITAALSYV